jgi:hypothetical protein
MHRSHYPFNETFGMGQQDADENDAWRDRSLTDDRPHRDIFSNRYKDFEKINIKRSQSKNKIAINTALHRQLLNSMYLDLTSGQTRIKKVLHYEYHKIIIDFYNGFSSIWLQ